VLDTACLHFTFALCLSFSYPHSAAGVSFDIKKGSWEAVQGPYLTNNSGYIFMYSTVKVL
jgi:hypothetical protein